MRSIRPQLPLVVGVSAGLCALVLWTAGLAGIGARLSPTLAPVAIAPSSSAAPTAASVAPTAAPTIVIILPEPPPTRTSAPAPAASLTPRPTARPTPPPSPTATPKPTSSPSPTATPVPLPTPVPTPEPPPLPAISLACANGVDNSGGLGVICEITIGPTSATVRECHGAAGAPTAACSTTTYPGRVTSVQACNGTANGGGATLRCSVTGVGSGAASVTLCVGTGAGGTLVEMTCTGPATSGVVLSLCNGSANGGGALVICSVRAADVTTVVVNGTSIQAAIDNAQTGDTIDVKAGGYAGFDVTKRLLIAGSGAVRVEGPGTSGNVVQVKAAGAELRGIEVSGATVKHGSCIAVLSVADVILDHVVAHDSEAGYGIRVYGASAIRAMLIAPTIHHTACGIQFNAGGSGSTVSDPIISDTDRMIVNDPTPGNDTGGMGMSFHKTNGLVTVTNPRFDRNHSVARDGKPASYDYGWDGSHFELYGGTKAVTIIGGELRGGVIVVETGKGSADPDNVGLTMRGTKVWGFRDEPTTENTKSAKGFLFRSMVDALIEDCEFRQLDWHVFLLERTGNYATGATVDQIRIRNNRAWLKPGDNRWITIGANVPLTPTTLASSGNRVYTQPGGTVASVQGQGKTSDLPTFQSWAPAGATWEAGSTWGPETVPPPAETPLAKATRERDEARALLAAANAKVASLTVERDDARDEVTEARSETVKARAEVDRVKAAAGRAAAELATV